MDEELDNEPTYKQAAEIREKALKQMEIIKEKSAKLEAELEELNYLQHKYDAVECAAEDVANRTKKWLDFMGYDLNSNKRIVEKAYQEYLELECYIGYKRTDYYAGAAYRTVVEIPTTVYKGDGKGGMLRDERGEPVELDVLEMCQYDK